MRQTARRVKRIFDSLPIAAHIYVTEKCNLRCRYCTEYDNSLPSPSLETVCRWVDKLRALGCIRIGLQGGEPLLHHDIHLIVRHIKNAGMGCSMSTNGFLLTAERIAQLEAAGLDNLQISVDRVSETPETKKCLDLLAPKLELLAQSRLRSQLSAVLYDGSVEELTQLFARAMELGVPVKAHLVHAGTTGGLGLPRDRRDRLLAFIDWEIEEKRRGGKIRSSHSILQYQRSILTGAGRPWTCLAGYKYLFVSSQGKVWPCSMKREPALDLLSVTPDDLRANRGPKPCQDGCGVYCVVSESLLNGDPIGTALRDVAPWPLRAKTR